MKRIRILYLINNLIPGGAQRYIIDASRALDKSMFDVQLVSMGKGNFFEGETDVPILELGMEKEHPHPLRVFRMPGIIRRFQPHIMHTHLQYADTLGQIMGRMAGVPAIVTTIHNTVEWRREKLSLLSIIEDSTLQNADRIIAVSESLKTFLIEKRGAEADRITVLPCGVNLSLFYGMYSSRAELRRRFGYEDGLVVFACTAHFRPEKRHDFLLRRFAALKKETSVPIKLLLIGATGILSDEVDTLVKNLELQNEVVMCGGDRIAVAEYLAASDIYYMHSEYEGTSLAVAEAMACGLPVLLPRLPHFTQQANDGEQGSFFDFNDEQNFVQTALRLVGSRAMRMKYGDAARIHAMNMYGIESHIQKLSGIYKQLFDRYVVKKQACVAFANE